MVINISHNLYVITERRLSRSRTNYQLVEAALRGGATMIQLREKTWSKVQLKLEAAKLVPLCKAHNALFIVNDHVDIALEVGADGVHLGQDDMPIAEARARADEAGKHLIIGKSTHRLEQAMEADKEGADYIAIGPVFPTRSKDYTIGLEVVRMVVKSVSKPVVAIGGITLENVNSVLAKGAQNIAVIKEVVSADDPQQRAQELAMVIDRTQYG